MVGFDPFLCSKLLVQTLPEEHFEDLPPHKNNIKYASNATITQLTKISATIPSKTGITVTNVLPTDWHQHYEDTDTNRLCQLEPMKQEERGQK